ncbi:hypothetical protein SAMN06265338_10386 [Rhodoblastus acidophilus]|uniref:Cytochrome C oxidase subunit IV n=1 Tax=Rhodoblastus acidophilus TaxID=1074 RepID=A0A212R9B5_RHOAC|nr:hypothetical protein [Rhodoblastus acidophilus]PPQ37911.1 hypothetical protein CKO16_11970 [Rhodoblastus acidophilus]RAI24020.1 hypothetical protein CH337_01690 [Rhodoblastus acidophilus]SNB68596.1 hypothetical protein SAMN06265338_10386 [Rhodoblastus acidophilus]
MRRTFSSLVQAFLLLLTLSLALAFAAEAQASALWLAAVTLAAALKTRIVLARYLGLDAAPGALAGFFAATFLVLALVAGSILVFPTPIHQARGNAHLVATTGAPGANE